jgi:hypothetical protein
MNAAARASAAARLDRVKCGPADPHDKGPGWTVAANSAKLPECSVDNAQVIADE